MKQKKCNRKTAMGKLLHCDVGIGLTFTHAAFRTFKKRRKL